MSYLNTGTGEINVPLSEMPEAELRGQKTLNGVYLGWDPNRGPGIAKHDFQLLVFSS